MCDHTGVYVYVFKWILKKVVLVLTVTEPYLVKSKTILQAQLKDTRGLTPIRNNKLITNG